MRKHFLHFLVLFVITSLTAVKAQVVVINNFESAAKDTTFQLSIEGKSIMKVTDNTTDKHQGSASLQVNALIDSVHEWGSFAQLLFNAPKGQYLDWSSSDSLSIWIKVNKAPKNPDYMVLRVHMGDQPSPDGAKEEYIYENATIIDQANGWVELKIPLVERNQPGTDKPNDQGFILAPTDWGGFTYNNKKLDRDKIVSFNLGIITTGWTAPRMLPQDSVEILFDGFVRFGTRKVPFVVFNGKVVSSDITNWGAWSSSLTIEKNAGSVAGKSALKWATGDAWSGTYFDFAKKNMAGNWVTNDTLKMRVKVPAEFNDDLRIQFMSDKNGGGEAAIKYVATAADYKWDNTWKEIKFPVKNYVVSDGKTGFDSTMVKKFEILPDKGSAKASAIYLEDIWMGSPQFDVIAPEAPKGLTATAADFANLVGWTDVPGETGEVYDVYYSTKPITSLTASGVEMVKAGIPHGTGTVTHLLRTAPADADVTYYYAITCTDANGNISTVANTAAATTNKAKGVPTIVLGTPTGFKADGKITEFTSLYTTLGYKPISIKKSEGTGFVVANQKVDGDADISALVYLTIDNENIYVAFDITDDVVDGTTADKNYERDCPDMYIGLYNFHGPYHVGYSRGATPDYHIRFNQNKALFDGQNLDSLLGPGTNYYWGPKVSGGYIVEAKIPLVDMAKRRNSGYNGDLDSLFKPVEGMRIPIDFSLNDADLTGIREGILTYSPNNEDKAYQDVSRWTYTWIGKKTTVGVAEPKTATVKSYSLSQNYPNPFNPSTTIRYSIPQAGMVTLKVFNILGKEVATLVNEVKNMGSFEVKFDASNFASGVYFYQIEAGSFRQVNKMLLLK